MYPFSNEASIGPGAVRRVARGGDGGGEGRVEGGKCYPRYFSNMMRSGCERKFKKNISTSVLFQLFTEK